MNVQAKRKRDGIPKKSIRQLLGAVSIKAKAEEPPGTPVFIGEQRAESVRLTVMDYSETAFEESDVDTVEAFFPYRERKTVTWLNINGLHEVDVITKLGDYFDIHSLVQEDIANTSQRPKLEDYESHLYLVIRMLQYDMSRKQVITEQVSLILGPNYVITFQEREGDVFDLIRDRIRHKKGRVRKMGADYLFYSLLDAVIDGYFSALEQIGEQVEFLESEVMKNPTPAVLSEIQNLRTHIIFLRKSVWPLREAVNALEKTESVLVKKGTKIFLRDVYDHTIQLIDTIETFRDVAASLFEMYLSMVSNRMNEVMKVLTVIATIFIPITFVAGIYGMNFEHMPELKWPWAYPAVWSIIIGVVLGMLLFFKKRNWI